MTQNDNDSRGSSTRVFVYRGNVPLWLGLLLAAPLLVFAFSLIAALMVGGAVAALVLPFVFRRQVRATRRNDSIELERSEFHRVDEPPRQLPEHKV